jgi:hypothetical protein
MLQRLDFRTLYCLKKAKMIINLLHSSNLVLRFSSSYFVQSDESIKFCGKNDIDLDSNYAYIKRTVINWFKRVPVTKSAENASGFTIVRERRQSNVRMIACFLSLCPSYLWIQTLLSTQETIIQPGVHVWDTVYLSSVVIDYYFAIASYVAAGRRQLILFLAGTMS